MMHSSHPIELSILSIGLALFAVACLQDWALRLVSNRIPIAIAASGITVRCLESSLTGGLLAAGTVFVAAALLWRRGWLGGADVKLFAAGALLVPPGYAPDFVLASCVAGGALGLAYAGLSYAVPAPAATRPSSRIRRYVRLEQRRLRRRGPLPYAMAIAAGASFILLRG